MRRKNRWLFTAVTLLLLLVLAACGGGTGDVEATGSESVGDALPTPITGAKALPTRANAATLMPDILIIAPSSAITAVDLITVSTQLALPNAHFALLLYGDSDVGGSFDFAADVAEAMTALDAPAQTSLTFLPAALAAGLQLPGWRANSTPRLILLLVGGTVPPDEEMLALAATAVSQNMRLYILATSESADWAEVAEVGNGRVLLLPENPPPGAIVGSISNLIMEVITETAP